MSLEDPSHLFALGDQGGSAHWVRCVSCPNLPTLLSQRPVLRCARGSDSQSWGLVLTDTPWGTCSRVQASRKAGPLTLCLARRLGPTLALLFPKGCKCFVVAEESLSSAEFTVVKRVTQSPAGDTPACAHWLKGRVRGRLPGQTHQPLQARRFHVTVTGASALCNPVPCYAVSGSILHRRFPEACAWWFYSALLLRKSCF